MNPDDEQEYREEALRDQMPESFDKENIDADNEERSLDFNEPTRETFWWEQ